ncbi:hypothetical protein V3C99_008545 [Haemonchus contortus]
MSSFNEDRISPLNVPKVTNSNTGTVKLFFRILWDPRTWLWSAGDYGDNSSFRIVTRTSCEAYRYGEPRNIFTSKKFLRSCCRFIPLYRN